MFNPDTGHLDRVLVPKVQSREGPDVMKVKMETVCLTTNKVIREHDLVWENKIAVTAFLMRHLTWCFFNKCGVQLRNAETEAPNQ